MKNDMKWFAYQTFWMPQAFTSGRLMRKAERNTHIFCQDLCREVGLRLQDLTMPGKWTGKCTGLRKP